jgi:hypothetical protein
VVADRSASLFFSSSFVLALPLLLFASAELEAMAAAGGDKEPSRPAGGEVGVGVGGDGNGE